MNSVQYLLLFVLMAMLAVGLSPDPSLAQEEIICETEVTVQADGGTLKLSTQ